MAGGQPPKRRTSDRKSAHRRSQNGPKTARQVNSLLSRAGAKVTAYVSRRVSGKKKVGLS